METRQNGTLRRGSGGCRALVAAVAFGIAAAALSVAAVDLPWVYDTSGRTVVVAKSSADANCSDDFFSMAGNWSYPSAATRLRTVPWQGVTIVVR